MHSSQDGIENESEKIYLHIIYLLQDYNMNIQWWNNKKRDINCAKVKELKGSKNYGCGYLSGKQRKRVIIYFFSYIYSYVFKKIFGINLAPSINCCSLEPNPRDNSASCNSCGSWVVLSAPTTSDFSSRSFRASPLSISLAFIPDRMLPLLFSLRARFSSRLLTRAL